MKRLKTYLLSIIAVAAFSMLMMFNLSTTDEGFMFSLCGETVMANGGADCLENTEEWEGPRILNFVQDNPDHPLNCSYSGNGCVT